jgi:MoxR-like ATPase
MASKIDEVLKQVSAVILGKEEKVKLALSCILAGGHLLVEDLPGMGKTTLAQALSKTLGLDYQRIQFTSDLLPADILGVSVFNQKEGDFNFRKGPIFSQFLLADEINRATPKTQSALLESMEEGTVTIDGQEYELPQPFVVIATQNPSNQMGTYPLPESQLDRFLMRISLGYPSEETEKKLIFGENPREQMKRLQAVCNGDDLIIMKKELEKVHMTQAIVDYVHRLVVKSRESVELSYGLSPRGSLALINAAKAWAVISHRDHLLPEDIQAVFEAVVEHRIKGAHQHTGSSGSKSLARIILESVDVIAK